jgi:hypothetical protein
MEINSEIAAKVLATVDAGLVKGMGKPVPGQMCVEAAVCYAMGLPHGDQPDCVSSAIRSLKITLNDANWSSDMARAKGMRRLALAQLGSAGVVDDVEFCRQVSMLAIRLCIPVALRAAASIHPDPTHKSALLNAAALCEREPTNKSARSARVAADAARSAAAWSARSADAARVEAYDDFSDYLLILLRNAKGEDMRFSEASFARTQSRYSPPLQSSGRVFGVWVWLRSLWSFQ